MFFLSKLANILVNPFNLVLITLAFGSVAAGWGRGWLRRLGQWLVGFAFAAVLVIAIIPVGTWSLMALETRFPPPETMPEHVDGIVVLGGVFDPGLSEVHNTLALNGSAERLWYGLARPKPGDVWLLVTSARHMPRAIGCFRAIGWEVVPYPVDYITGGPVDPIANFSLLRGLSRLNRAVHEFIGLAYYYSRGWVSERFPGPVQPSG